jgi:hypothetical protein
MVDVAFCRAISVQFLVARAVAVWSASFGPRCLDSDVDFQCGKFPRSSPEVVQSQILRSVTCRGLSPVCPRFNMAERTSSNRSACPQRVGLDGGQNAVSVESGAYIKNVKAWSNDRIELRNILGESGSEYRAHCIYNLLMDSVALTLDRT